MLRKYLFFMSNEKDSLKVKLNINFRTSKKDVIFHNKHIYIQDKTLFSPFNC